MEKLAIVSCDLNMNYLSFFPIVHLLWNKLIKIPVKLILISETIPNFLNKYKKDIILFNPIKNINTAFQAQCIRLLYPCLFNNKIIIISDIDILPLSKSFFEYKCEDKFIVMRDAYQKQQMFGICHNMAMSSTWKDIFKINDLNDVITTLNNWYNIDYKKNKSNKHWYTDQKKLFEYVNSYNKVIILKDKITGYKSFDLKRVDNLVLFLENKNHIINNLNLYTNIHCNKPYYYIVKELLKLYLPNESLYELEHLDKSFRTYDKMKAKIMNYAWSSSIQRIENVMSKKINYKNESKDFKILILCKSFYYYKCTLINLIYNNLINDNNLYLFANNRSYDRINKETKMYLKNYNIKKINNFNNYIDIIDFKFNTLLIIKPGFLIIEPKEFSACLKSKMKGQEVLILRNLKINNLENNKNLCCHDKYIENPITIYNLDINNLSIKNFFYLIRLMKKNYNFIKRLI